MHTINASRLAARQVVPCRKQHALAAPVHQHAKFATRVPLRKQLEQLVVRAIAEPPMDAMEETDMFCYQCEQTLHGEGCTSHGVCGKTAETAALQDLLNYQLKGLSSWACFAHKNNIPTPQVDSFVKAAIFSTLTNVNFDSERFREYCLHCHDLMVGLKKQLNDAGVQGAPAAPELPWFDVYGNPVNFDLMKASCGDVTVEAFYKVADQVSLANRGSGWPTSLDILKPSRANITVPALHTVADQVSLAHRRVVMKEQTTLLGLHELLTYGLRGMAAYAHHAEMLGQVDADIDDFCEKVMAFLASEEAQDPAQVLGMCMELGAENFKVMAMLDHAHTSRYGNPVPTQVPITPVEGKAILISGHDMHDLEDLLRQTEGLGINVYTHGEMLPGHGYPGLKKYKHLVGNYGGAWYRQRVDFANFPGPILMTTNCIVDPTPAYADRIFTTGEVGVQAASHLATKDFSPVIAKALELPGFTYVPDTPKSVTVGFGHATVLSVADKVLGAIAAGQLSHIFVIGGCDNFEKERKYYTEVAKGLPQDTMVLTLGCGKYRFYDHDFGHLANGLPRLLDMGQCNDAYSALVVATKLAEALNTDVNSLPLSLDISWFEQKAVAVLLTLLHLGVRNVRLGPNLPAFITPDALAYLVEHFNIMPADTQNPLKDIDRMMANA